MKANQKYNKPSIPEKKIRQRPTKIEHKDDFYNLPPKSSDDSGNRKADIVDSGNRKADIVDSGYRKADIVEFAHFPARYQAHSSV